MTTRKRSGVRKCPVASHHYRARVTKAHIPARLPRLYHATSHMATITACRALLANMARDCEQVA